MSGCLGTRTWARVQDSGSRVLGRFGGLGFMSAFGLYSLGLGFRVWGIGFMV